MSPSLFLSGKVSRQTLPFVELPPPLNAPPLKRLALKQGELTQFHDGGEEVRYIAYVELRAGSIRGNHYHKIKKEWAYVISGKLIMAVEDIATHERASFKMEGGDLVFIAPGIAHALRTLEPGGAIEFSQAQFDAADIYPFQLEK